MFRLSVVYALAALALTPVLASDVNVFTTTDHVFGTDVRRVGAYTTRANNTCIADTEGDCFLAVQAIADRYLDTYHDSIGVWPELTADTTGATRHLTERSESRRRLSGSWFVFNMFFGSSSSMYRRRELNEGSTRKLASVNPSPPTLDLGVLTDYSFVSLDGSIKFQWQNSNNKLGWAGDIFIGKNNQVEDTQELLFGGKCKTDGKASRKNLEKIYTLKETKNLDHTSVQLEFDQVDIGATLQEDFDAVVAEMLSYDATPGYHATVPSDCAQPGLCDFTNGISETIVMDIKPDKIEKGALMFVGGDSDDLIIFRWDKDHQCATKANGCEGKLEIKEGSAIIPTGELTVNRFVHIVDHIHSTGALKPPPQELLNLGYGIPASPDGTPLLHAAPFAGGFFTGYWFLTGKKFDSSQVNVIGGLYTNSPEMKMTESAGMSIEPNPYIVQMVDEKCWRSVGVAADASLTLEMEAELADTYGTKVEGVKFAIQEKVPCKK